MTRYALAIVLLALGAQGCGKHASGGCREDVDCPPGFDCVSGACARRERLKFTGPGGAPGAPREEEAPPPPPPPVEIPRPAAPAPPPIVKPRQQPKAVPAPEPPPLPPAPTVPEQRLPAWKQRLKNT